MKYNFLRTIIVLLTISVLITAVNCIEADINASNSVNKDSLEKVLVSSLDELYPETYSNSIYVINLEENIEIYSKSSDAKINPAGTVKLMTAYTAYNLLPDLDILITASDNAVKSTRGLNAKIKSGESYKARDLLYALLVGGANDAANVLAEYCCGSIDEFVVKMNDNAALFGAKNTYYTNPTGLHDDNMYTTARDTAIIAKNVYYINTLLEMSNNVSYDFSPTNVSDKKTLIHTRNRLLAYNYGVKYYNSNARGLSYSSTEQAGHCLITTCTKGGLSYLLVIMNGPEIENTDPKTKEQESNVITPYLDAKSLIDLCINNFAKQVIFNTSKPIYELPVRNSASYDHVILYPSEKVELFLPKNFDIEKISLVPEIYSEVALAPVKNRDVFGKVNVMYDKNICLTSVELISDTDIDRSPVLYILYLIESFIKSKFFTVFIIIAITLLVLYFLLAVYVNIQYKNGKYRRRKR